MKSPLEQLLKSLAPVAQAPETGGMSGCTFSLLAASMRRTASGHLLVVTPGPEMAQDLQLDLAALLPDYTVLVAPLVEAQAPDRDAAWLAFLGRLAGARAETSVVIAPAATLLEPLPEPATLRQGVLSVAPGEVLEPEPLLRRLSECGFTRVDQVDGPSQFARRGGIIDLFPPTRSTPVRIELFGKQVESVRALDLATQRSFEALPQGVAFPLLSPDLSTRPAALADYLPGATVAAVQADMVRERLQTLASFRHDPDTQGRIRSAEALVSDSRQWVQRDASANLACVTPVSLGDGYAGIAALVRALGESGHHVALFCGLAPELKVVTDGLAEHGCKPGSGLSLLPGDVEGSRVLPAQKFAVLSLHELLGRARRRMGLEPEHETTAGALLDDFVQMEVGDYVVHLQHGIARYQGMETMSRDGRTGEFLTLEFDEGLVLHVPVTNADVVQKYIGVRGEVPRLSRYNTAAWSEKKLRAQQSVLKLAQDLLEVQALRAQEAGHPCKPDGNEQAEYEAACPFRDTPDQQKASVAIKLDMERKRPMDRLVCGDVGYGKTELAMRAAFKMVQEGRQVAVLVPTTVLAQQHFLTFTERMKQFAVIVDVLSRFRTGAEQRRTIEGLAEGKVDIVIGTHRLLSQDVQFKDLGLVIIDEEQRFGVEHKERLKHMRRTVDVLTLSATPIPRTLHQAMLGLRDISNLTTPPQSRLAVQTRIAHFEDNLVREAIRAEIARDGQVFFVHNRVFDIDVVAERIQRIVPEARVEIGHGQMAEGELEEVMLRFMARQTDVLVCTTIIESGIDVRSANTMFIDQAHMYGLADLHQLRGRVGRYHHQAHCWLLVPDDVSVPEIAAKRLKAILQYQALGSGFKIAMRDLELRGAGNLLGPEQSGHIASVGYDLYCRLLERAVRKMKHETVPPDVDTQLDLGLDLRLPVSWIKSPRHRLEIYRKLARLADDKQAEDLRREAVDRFGRPPREFERLLTAALVRARLARLGVVALSAAEDHLKIRALSAQRTHKLLALASKNFRVLDETTLALPLRAGLHEPEDQLRFLSNLLQSLARHGVYSSG
ncbi:MAG: transcription-repair coupling factor [Planctomycetes bacterium]|nr:transcription-repair coupling factor [Planctomycetota bacterium]